MDECKWKRRVLKLIPARTNMLSNGLARALLVANKIQMQRRAATQTNEHKQNIHGRLIEGEETTGLIGITYESVSESHRIKP